MWFIFEWSQFNNSWHMSLFFKMKNCWIGIYSNILVNIRTHRSWPSIVLVYRVIFPYIFCMLHTRYKKQIKFTYVLKTELSSYFGTLIRYQILENFISFTSKFRTVLIQFCSFRPTLIYLMRLDQITIVIPINGKVKCLLNLGLKGQRLWLLLFRNSFKYWVGNTSC